MATRSDAQKNAERRYEKKRGERSKNWACVAYPESAPSNWLELLKEQFVDALVSPLHDKDTNADGEVKKAHWHIILSFGTLKSEPQVREILEKVGITVAPQKVSNFRSYARYLCHLDNPEKYQYEPKDVIEIGGCDYLSAIGLPTDKYAAIGEMIEWCDANQIYSYAELMRYARCEKPDWFRCLCDKGTYVMKEYLKTAYWETRQG